MENSIHFAAIEQDEFDFFFFFSLPNLVVPERGIRFLFQLQFVAVQRNSFLIEGETTRKVHASSKASQQPKHEIFTWKKKFEV